MITLFVALYSLLCLCTTVTSDTKRFHVKTVKPGEDVTMECNISEVKVKNNLVWYRRSLDDVPLVFARQYGQNSYTFVVGFNDSRFSVTVNNHQFDLNINGIIKDDGGEYFCGELDGTTLKFTSGTRLQFEGEEMKLCPTPGTLQNTDSVTHQGSNSKAREEKSSDITDLHINIVKRGEDVTMECNISGLRKKNYFSWYRQSFGQVPQFLARPYFGSSGYIFVDGFNDSRFSVTVKDQKFDLNIKETRENDGGEYFCGYVEGTTVKFTSGTRLQFEEMKLCPTPGTLQNTDSVTHQGSNSRDGEGQTSDIKDVYIKTVKRGEAVTMECNISEVRNKNTLAWYRQSFGKVPQFLVRQYSNTQGYTFVEGFNDSRFSVTVKDQKFDLNINKMREDDGGEYFCGELDGTTLKFTSGTRLQFEGEEMKLCPNSSHGKGASSSNHHQSA